MKRASRFRPVLRILARVLVVAAALAWAFAQDAIVGDRPDFTESPLEVPKGSVQLEAGFTFAETPGVVGYAFAASPARRFDRGFVSASLGVQGTERVAYLVEAYAFSREDVGGSTAILADAGAVFTLFDRWLFDARVGTGLGDAETDLFAGAGFITRW